MSIIILAMISTTQENK
ncbi:hypothetical protein L1910_RS01655 [Escherichia coli]|nr:MULTISPECIES: hypothetical protein [Escherichia]MCZ8623147.1 hypothetical protein [Escherichia albertii]MCZ8763982.1 hypothetical protein [Escherichia albertii]MCZ8868629.1 hypothetical protein [Escherichia albertii]MCZ8890245.1 hypothetical protein [Escherichia albertii]MDZ6985682.1 hypothetical protein [Escherichia coli]